MNITLFGVPVYIDGSTFIIVAIIFFWGLPYMANGLTKKDWKVFILGAFFTSLGVIATTLLHEFSHAVVANKFGIPIVGAGMNWVGAFVRAEVSYQITPFQMAVVAFVGPLSTANVALLTAIANSLFVKPGIVKNSLHFFAMVNLKLAAWNMLPFGNMDGQRVFDWFTNATALSGDMIAMSVFGALWAFIFFFVFVFADSILKKF